MQFALVEAGNGIGSVAEEKNNCNFLRKGCDMIIYDRLWKLMKEKGITRYRLIKDYDISPSLLQRMKRNNNISTYTAAVLCKILDCRLEDIMEYVPVEGEERKRRKKKAVIEPGEAEKAEKAEKSDGAGK